MPLYRNVKVTYSGTFTNGFQQLNNVSIPNATVAKHAGKSWVNYSIRESISVIDDIVERSRSSEADSEFGLDTGNLKIVLQDKVYEGFSIVDIRGVFSIGDFVGIQSAVRSKILDLALKLESEVPEASQISLIGSKMKKNDDLRGKVGQVANQIINYGSVTSISSTGDGSNVAVQVQTGNSDQLVKALANSGLSGAEVGELVEIVANESPMSAQAPIGKKAGDWLSDKVAKGAREAWGVGKSVAIDVIKAAIKQYYGL